MFALITTPARTVNVNVSRDVVMLVLTISPMCSIVVVVERLVLLARTASLESVSVLVELLFAKEDVLTIKLIHSTVVVVRRKSLMVLNV